MEVVGAALLGAIATSAAELAVWKLSSLVYNQICGKKEKPVVHAIISEIGFINSIIQESHNLKGLSLFQTECIKQLKRLAFQIEDGVDLVFAAGNGKKGDIKNMVDLLMNESHQMKERIKSYLLIRKGIVGGTPNKAVETKEQMLSYLAIALAIVNGSAEWTANVNGELQELLVKPRIREWLDENLNRLRRTVQDDVDGSSHGAVVGPAEHRVFLGDSNTSGWSEKNPECLLYLCLFRPNHDVNTKSLMRRWVAEGLVPGDNLADENLRFFIDNGIIRSTKTSNNGEVETCQHSSEMHANISEKSKSQAFMVVCDSAASIAELAHARRLSVHPAANVQLNENDELHGLRTLAVFPADSANGDSYKALLDFSRYKVLRVLDLKECAELNDDSHIKAICKQVLMKYLSINLDSNIKIPRSIMELNQLETLDLSVTASQTLTVHKDVLLLPMLKHLLGKFQLSRKESVKFHWDLEDFLTNKSKLETLEGFVTGSRYGFQDLISLIKSLRKVKIWCKPDASEGKLDVLSSAITNFIRCGTDEAHRSRSLSIDFEACSRGFVNEIRPMAGILGSLELRGKLSLFPPFVAGLSAIVELCLCSTGLSWVDIRVGLKDVSGLKYLKLVEDELENFDIPSEAAGHLKSIQRISIVSSRRLDITIPHDALPFLVSFRILCQALDVSPATVPLNLNISHMGNLEEIALHFDVAHAIRTEWEEAARQHSNQNLRVTEGP